MHGLAADVDAAEALAAAAGAGPYFALEPWAEGAGWRQASLLVSDPAVLADRVTHARAVIARRAGIAPAEVTERVLFRLSPLVLRGNIASALAGAAGMLARSFPDRAEIAGQLAAGILALGPLRGAGEFVQPDASQPRRFLVRRSCCLYYRVPGGGTCGDCVLTPEHVRRQQWQAALR